MLLESLPIIARETIFYKGIKLEEMDVQTIIQQHAKVVIVEELAHNNLEGHINTPLSITSLISF